MKYCLLFCLLIGTWQQVDANIIDSLSTKEEVQHFLTEKFSKSGIIFLSECADVSQSVFYRMPPHKAQPDTVYVEDPVTHSKTLHVFPPDTSNEKPVVLDIDTTTRYPRNFPYNMVAKRMNQYPFHFYKEDIDGNGYTDLVVDAGIVLVVMDMGNKFEAHMFSYSTNWDSYSFRKFISLPDGTIAMLLRHDHNPCKSVAHMYWESKDVYYVTNTLVDRSSASSTMKIDTLYKITTGIDSETDWTANTYPRKMIGKKYADTVDMKLYNMTDTIVYKFHGFAKYNKNYTPLNISKVVYNYYQVSDLTTYNCDIYLEINKNGKCFVEYWSPVFSGTLDTERLNDLWHFIAYINIRSKLNLYRCEMDHSSGAVLTVYFDDGSVKRIRFWAYRPPIGLGYLMKSISDISRIVNWVPSNRKRIIERVNTRWSNDYNVDNNNSNQWKCAW